MTRPSLSMLTVIGVNAISVGALSLLGAILLLKPQSNESANHDAQAVPIAIHPLAGPTSIDRPARVVAARPSSAPPVVDSTLFSPSSYSLDKITDLKERQEVELGRRLIAETPSLIGPQVDDEKKRFAGNELACKNCHLDAGLKPFAASYVGVTSRYPSFRSRENKVGSIEERVNGCMERSMNGKPLPETGPEMRAIVAYMNWLSHLAPQDGKLAGKGFVAANFPSRAANPAAGAKVYQARCAICHGTDGLGQKAPSGYGYQFPPIAGHDSYNDGAGMNRVLTAMAFIKSNMPLGSTAESPQLTDDEAYDVAGYINSLSRPIKVKKEADFPDPKLKPMSTPYPPYADNFSTEQHKFGPFGPIYDYYVAEHNLKKAK